MLFSLFRHAHAGCVCSSSSRLSLITAGLVAGMFSVPISASAQQYDTVEEAIYSNPTVLEQRSSACQARSRFDIARSAEFPQVNFSLSGGTTLSDRFERRRTSTLEREYATDRRFDRKDIDGTIRLSQTLYDGGRIRMDKRIAVNDRDGALLAAAVETDTVAADILTVAFEYRLQQQLKTHFDQQRLELSEIIRRIEERVDLGAGRVADLRESRLIELEVEIRQEQIRRQLDFLEKDIVSRFRISSAQALSLLDRFSANRPDELPVVEGEDLRTIRRVDLDLQSVGFQVQRLKAERQPSFLGHIDTTLFDVDSFSYEYEVVGRMEMSVPIYDGGSNKARRTEAEWRRRGLEAQRSTLLRTHESQTRRIISDLTQARESLKDADERIEQLTQRYESLLAREGQTQTDPLTLARAIGDIGDAKATRINELLNIEVILLRGVFFADQLGEVLDLTDGDPAC